VACVAVVLGKHDAKVEQRDFLQAVIHSQQQDK
jgi:hypothetical protein